MRIAIIQFPGSNCERETALAVKRVGMEPVEFLWNAPTDTLQDFAGFIIVGGFSYEDRGRAGVIAAMDPLMDAIAIQSAQGKPVLGICNGAQILVESGLVPGLSRNQIGMVLTDNKRIQNGKVLGTGYYNAWIHMRLSKGYQSNAFTNALTPQSILHIPVAHGEGRFVIPPALLTEMEHHGLGAFQYCDAEGVVKDEFPVNPNGSLHNLAAVSNAAGNVMAMMPHPERTPAGDPIFLSMRRYIERGSRAHRAELFYQPRHESILAYKKMPAAKEIIVESIIMDNQAVSIETTFQRMGIPVSIARFVHWEIECDSPHVVEEIKKTGVLFNERKEKIVSLPTPRAATDAVFLVRAKDDIKGQERQQLLEKHFNIKGIHSIKYSVLWSAQADKKDDIEYVIQSHLLYNPTAHECYQVTA